VVPARLKLSNRPERVVRAISGNGQPPGHHFDAGPTNGSALCTLDNVTWWGASSAYGRLSEDGSNNFRDELKLRSKSLDTMLAVLVANQLAAKDLVMQALYGDRADPPQDAAVGVWLCRLRKRLKLFGITIHLQVE
jgi:hypothetical protein